MSKQISLRFIAANAFKLWLAAIFLTFAQIASAQDLASVSGTVTDQNGAVVAGAVVTLSSRALAVERTATTSESGTYSIPQVRPGLYSIAIAQTSFQTSRADDFQLGVAQTRTFDVTLLPGEASATVTITSGDEAATLDQSSARLGVNVTAREVNELPVNGRTYSQLYLTAPGAQNTGAGTTADVRFNGRSNQQNQVKYDGVESSAIFDQSPGYVTVQGSQFRLQNSLENIQEFRVDSSNYPAEYGTGTGGQINVVGKQGTNDFRGSVFYYLRNDAFDARNFFDGADASRLQLNQFGASFGGPLAKDRVFVFGSYEGLRQRAGINNIELTPSVFARDFVNFFGTTDARGEAARAALGISSANASAALARIQALRATGIINSFPVGAGGAVSLGATPNAGQFVQLNSVQTLDEDVFNIRLDGVVTDNYNFFMRFNAPRGELVSPDGTSGRNILAKQNPRNFASSLTQIYGTNLFNETKFGINQYSSSLATLVPNVGLNGFDLSTIALRLGGNIVSPGVNGGSTTGLAEPGGLTRQSSAGNGRAQPVKGTSYSFVDNLSVIAGKHNMKFGGEIRFNQVRFDQLGGTTLTFGSLNDFLLNQNVTAAFIGDLSLPGDFSIATNPLTTLSRPFEGDSVARNRYYIAYGQDEFKISEGFTVNYGLRYEYYSPVTERNDRQILFDVTSGRILPSDQKPYAVKRNNFGPRLGVTYAPKFLGNKTVVRAGAGIYYGPGQFEDLIQPIESNVFRSQQTIVNGLSGATIGAVSNTNGVVQAFTPRAYDVSGYQVPERVLQYSASVQQELPGSIVLTVGYVGSQGRNLFLRSIDNTILGGNALITDGTALPRAGIVNRTGAVGSANAGRVVGVTTIREYDVIGFALANNQLVANPASRLQPFGEIDYKTSGGRDRYDALQVQVQRRFAGGLSLGGQYSFAKSRGNTQGSNEATTAQDPFNFAGEFGNNTFDIRHSGNITALYEVPIGANRALDLGRAGNFLFGGLQIGGIYNARSGTPLNILVTRPDVVIQCVQTGGCGGATTPNGASVALNQGFTAALPGTINATAPLPPGFIAVINTPGGNASRNTRRPNVVAGVNPYTVDGDGRFFLNPAAFATPTAGTYGDLARNALYGPSFQQFDLTFQKRFRFTEKTNIEFRTEVFNIFNRANFANPPITLPNSLPSLNAAGTTISSNTTLQPNQPFSFSQAPNFGLLTSTVSRSVGLGTNRQIQFALRFNF